MSLLPRRYVAPVGALIVACLVLVWLTGNAMGGTWSRKGDGQYWYWYIAGAQKFRYDYRLGQWWHYSGYGGWSTLGAAGLGAAFIGDGVWHDLGNGFTYRYLSTHDYGYFRDGAFYRFYYRYGPGQWYHTGNSPSWQVLGSGSRSAAFVGGGLWYDLGNGFTYWYYAPSDSGYFRRSGKNRFFYRYASGQWYHTGNTPSWQALGGLGRTAAFFGNGLWYDLSNGYTYSYSLTNDYGYFKDDGFYRFAYQYGPGQWYHTGNSVSWQELGASGRSAAFVGTGDWYDLGDGWWYSYPLRADLGYWSRQPSRPWRFRYDYRVRQWYFWEIGPVSASWQQLVSERSEGKFIGNGDRVQLGWATADRLSMEYRYATDEIRFFIRLDSGEQQFLRYTYSARRWEDYYIADGKWYSCQNYLLSRFDYKGSTVVLRNRTYVMSVGIIYLPDSPALLAAEYSNAGGPVLRYLYSGQGAWWIYRGPSDSWWIEWEFVSNGSPGLHRPW